jgi:hypothetical protein
MPPDPGKTANPPQTAEDHSPESSDEDGFDDEPAASGYQPLSSSEHENSSACPDDASDEISTETSQVAEYVRTHMINDSDPISTSIATHSSDERVTESFQLSKGKEMIYSHFVRGIELIMYLMCFQMTLRKSNQ